MALHGRSPNACALKPGVYPYEWKDCYPVLAQNRNVIAMHVWQPGAEFQRGGTSALRRTWK